MHLVCLVSVLAGILISESRADDCVIAGVGPGPGAGPGATAGAGKTTAGATAGAGKTTAGATAGAGKTSAGATAGGGKTSAGATAGGGKLSAGVTAGGGKTSAGATAGGGKTSEGATAGGGETSAGATAGEGETTTDPVSDEEITTNKTVQDVIRSRRSVGPCAAYDDKVAKADTNCSAIMKYIGCTFKQDSKSACSVPDAHHTEIVNRNCSGKVNDTCKCELDYYKSNLSTNMCTAMKNLEDCLNKANTQIGCDGEKKADIHQFVTGRKTIACSTGGNIVAAVPSLLFCLLAAVYLKEYCCN